jgi:integrase
MSHNIKEINSFSLYATGKGKLLQEARKKGGRFSWLNTTLNRWGRFSGYCLASGVKSFSDITEEVVINYALTLENLSASTKQNYISAINTVMILVINEKWKILSPSKLTNTRRNNIRAIKGSIEPSLIEAACTQLRKLEDIRFEFAVRLAYEFGLRRKEALLLDFHVAKKQAQKSGIIDVTRGTKGGRGRNIERLVPVSKRAIALLDEICKTFPEHRCLLLKDSYKIVSACLSNKILPILSKQGISRFHDLRVAFACRRYFELTGTLPPCDGAVEKIDQDKDIRARLLISAELGHSRINITNSYLGSWHDKATYSE